MMMKKISLIVTIALGGFMLAQSGNVFAESEKSLYEEEEVIYQTHAPTAPGDEPSAPIDDYLPLLMVAGGALALYAVRRRQMMLNK